MPKNIVICFDGTNNTFGPQNTNVVRLVQMLDRNPLTQRLYLRPRRGDAAGARRLERHRQARF